MILEWTREINAPYHYKESFQIGKVMQILKGSWQSTGIRWCVKHKQTRSRVKWAITTPCQTGTRWLKLWFWWSFIFLRLLLDLIGKDKTMSVILEKGSFSLMRCAYTIVHNHRHSNEDIFWVAIQVHTYGRSYNQICCKWKACVRFKEYSNASIHH